MDRGFLKTNIFAYAASVAVIWLRNRARHVTYSYDFEKKKFRKKPFILICDHAAYDNYIFILPGFCFSKKLHAVIGNIHFAEPVFGPLVRHIGAISKNTYVNDPVALKKMIYAVRHGHSLMLFPEGAYSFCGKDLPVASSTVMFLKEMETDVILASTRGAYLAHPRFSPEYRKGPVEVHFSHLFTRDELKEKTISELEEKFFEHFKYNDFEWNAEKQHAYRGKYPNCHGIENIIWHCPKCHDEGCIYTQGNEIVCSRCGNSVIMDESYNIWPKTEKDFLPYSRIDEWFTDERNIINKKIKSDREFTVKENVILDMFSVKGRHMFSPAGEGILTIDRKKILYEGTLHGNRTRMEFDVSNIRGATVNDNRYFVMYYGKETVAFEFKDTSTPAVKAACIIEELHATGDEEWKKAIARAY